MSATLTQQVFLRHKWGLISLSLLFLAACVTINVYFPAAAVEKAADRIIEDIWGAPAPSSGALYQPGDVRVAQGWLWLDVVIRPAQAQADINIATPSINKLKQAMSARFQRLQPAFNSGAVGLTNDGLIALRDPNALGLKERGQVQQLVKQENSDRSALYREIAKANGHPEWERDIRNTFAKQWIKNARGGWWYQDDSGSWRQR